ncbi:hypothetical protein THTE_0025 [Thermogutta terrifontis]|uniref:Uncharacterized protein n=1 Tax=Thermogutta terrifontis TaxID=1331910 RepID=A0A286R9J3_9BACT|nr:hypothetical protein THTE_0025 [Thermogutta terrifontis]
MTIQTNAEIVPPEGLPLPPVPLHQPTGLKVLASTKEYA